MARKFTIAKLIAKGRRACDQEDSEELTDAEWQDEFSSVYSEFHAVIVEGGARVFESEEEYTGDGSQDYALPADFLAEIGVDYEASANGRRVELKALIIHERNATSGQTGTARYCAIVGDNVRLYPAPSSGTYYLIYVPQAPDLSESATTDEVDVIVPAGEQFFKWSLAAVGAGKVGDEERFQYCEQKAYRAKQDLLKWSVQRSLTQPKRRFVTMDPLDSVDDDEGGWDWPV